MDFRLTEEQLMMRSMVREFAQTKLWNLVGDKFPKKYRFPEDDKDIADASVLSLVVLGLDHTKGKQTWAETEKFVAKLLNENMSSAVNAKVYQNGWPKEPNALNDADAVVIFSDGGSDNIILGHLQEVDKLVKKGAGLAFLHYAIEVPDGRAGNICLTGQMMTA
jgi:hypothetical protein